MARRKHTKKKHGKKNPAQPENIERNKQDSEKANPNERKISKHDSKQLKPKTQDSDKKEAKKLESSESEVDKTGTEEHEAADQETKKQDESAESSELEEDWTMELLSSSPSAFQRCSPDTVIFHFQSPSDFKRVEVDLGI